MFMVNNFATVPLSSLQAYIIDACLFCLNIQASAFCSFAFTNSFKTFAKTQNGVLMYFFKIFRRFSQFFASFCQMFSGCQSAGKKVRDNHKNVGKNLQTKLWLTKKTSG